MVGVGGLSTGQDVYERILAGATLVQMYSALVYDGPGAVVRAKKELALCLKNAGYSSVQQAVGKGNATYTKLSDHKI